MAGKYRARVSSCKLKKRHPRGASGQSNPASCRHRAEARGARLIADTAMVAVDEVLADSSIDGMLQLPLEDMRLDDGSSDNGDGEFVGAIKSMVSEGELSVFTSCTNPNFNAVHRIWKSGSKMQNDVVAVLAAVAELIKDKGGNETDIEYFGALLTTLESTSDEEASKLGATAYLLNLIVKKISKDVLQRYFSHTIQILCNKLNGQVNSENVTLLKNLVATIGTVLRAQSSATLQQASTRMVLVSVATLSTHDKPWVRTMARRVLRAVLTDPVSSLDSGVHPAAAPVAEFATSVLQQHTGKDASSVVLMRILCLLEGIMHKVARSVFTRLAEAVLRLMACADGTVKCSAMQCLYRVMQRQPSDAVLPVETNAQFILAMRDFAPPPSDVAVTAYWMQALGEAHVCLTAKDPAASIRLLPRTFEIFVAFFDLSIKTLAQVTMLVLRRLLERCVQKHASMASYCVDLLEKAFNMSSVTVWTNILRTLAKAFEECGEAIETDTLNRTLKTLAQLRESEGCFCTGELDLTVGAAVRYVGVDRVLRAIPLDIDPDLSLAMTDLKRSWLLPVLRVNISNASLSMFVRFFLPLAVKLHKKASSADSTQAKIFAAVQHQIWELLPQFLNSAVEFEKYFPELAPVLGSALSERADLRMVVLASIRSAVRFAQQPDAPAERMEVMRRYAKNYLPILFNMYTLEDHINDHTEKAVHLATLETIRVYVELAPPELINRYIRSAVEKARSDEKSLLKKSHILDVLGALAKRANAEGLGTIFDAVREWFFTEEASLQKKALRNLEEIMRRNDDISVHSFFDSYAKEICGVLTEKCVEGTALSARATLIAILQLRMRELSTLDELKQFVTKMLWQVIICLDKTHNVHARKVAFKCIVETCQRLLSFASETNEESSALLQPVLNIIYEMATPKALSEPTEIPITIAQSTMVALNVIAQKYVRKLNASLLSRLMAHACSCIGDGRPAVRVLVIRLMRVLTQKLPDYALQQYKEMIISAVFEGQLTADVTQKVRKANRLLLEELVNRFGIQTLMKSTDKSDWLKQLKAIEKIRRRRERRTDALMTAGDAMESDADDDGDSRSLSSKSLRTAGADTVLDMLVDSDDQNDSGVDSEDEGRKSRGERSKANRIWLKGGDDAELVDLLDREAAIGKVTTIKPTSRDSLVRNKKLHSNANGTDSGFKLTEDGRLVIEDVDSLSAGRKRKQHENIKDMSRRLSSEKKKKFEGNCENTDEDSEAIEEQTEDLSVAGCRWKPGGHGIHRDASHGNLHPEGAGFKGCARAHGDFRKRGAKLEPFAYVPLRKKKGATTEMCKLIAGVKRVSTKGSKGKRRPKSKMEMA